MSISGRKWMAICESWSSEFQWISLGSWIAINRWPSRWQWHWNGSKTVSNDQMKSRTVLLKLEQRFSSIWHCSIRPRVQKRCIVRFIGAAEREQTQWETERKNSKGETHWEVKRINSLRSQKENFYSARNSVWPAKQLSGSKELSH